MEPKSITLLCLSESNRLPCTVNPSIHLITSSAICIITIIIMSPPPRPQHPPWSTAPTRTTPMPHTETRSWHGYANGPPSSPLCPYIGSGLPYIGSPSYPNPPSCPLHRIASLSIASPSHRTVHTNCHHHAIAISKYLGHCTPCCTQALILSMYKSVTRLR